MDKTNNNEVTVSELVDILSKIAENHPNALVYLPDTKKGKTRTITKHIPWADDDLVCLYYNKKD